MPLALFTTGLQTSDVDTLGRTLIPGVEPGGSRVGQPFKPALRINDVWASFRRADPGAEDNWAHVYLKLSQEADLSPGLILPVANLGMSMEAAASGAAGGPAVIDLSGVLAGSVWAAAYIGVRLEFDVDWAGGINAHLWLNYSVVDIEWMEWFIRWDYLDNVVDNTQEW